MREMLFANNVHHRGINVTVRRGIKWIDLRKDEVLLLSSVEHRTPPTKAHVICAITMPFFEIPAALLEHEHDPNCHTHDGLLTVMRQVYSGFMGSEAVTVVLYYVTE